MKDAFPQEHLAISEHIRVIKNARLKRNEILHWLWGESDNPAIMKTASLRPYRQEQFGSWTVDAIMAIAKSMLESSNRLSDWNARFQNDLLRAWRERTEQLSLLAHLASPSIRDQPSTPEPPPPQQAPSEE